MFLDSFTTQEKVSWKIKISPLNIRKSYAPFFSISFGAENGRSKHGNAVSL
jgi:hypothetical protein